jgi:phage terminase large subunit
MARPRFLAALTGLAASFAAMASPAAANSDDLQATFDSTFGTEARQPPSFDALYAGNWQQRIAELADPAQGRIGVVSPDPLLTTRAYWDIGGTGARADATAIWVVQFVGSQVRVLNYYEAVGQPLEAHVSWLRDNGYQRAECVLPHDGANAEKVYSISYESALQAAGFSTRVIPNMGAGAASKRIEAVRRVFPACWFHETTTDPGREALGWYHERKDEARNIGLGPEHDWASHGADAFGLGCVAYEEPRANKPNVTQSLNNWGSESWMGA